MTNIGTESRTYQLSPDQVWLIQFKPHPFSTPLSPTQEFFTLKMKEIFEELKKEFSTNDSNAPKTFEKLFLILLKNGNLVPLEGDSNLTRTNND